MRCEKSNYPEDPNIVFKDNSQIFKYRIIKKGVYPPKHKLKYTRRPAKYPIPHNYIVQTMYLKKNYVVEYLICYVDDKPLYQILFGKDLEKSVESDQSPSYAAYLYCKELTKDISNKNINANSKLSGLLLFGLRYKSVEAICKTLPSNKFVQIKLFHNYSASTQRKRILGLREQLQEFIEEEKENFFHPNDSI
ncbi:24736_t:CDS:2, partial [Dentiscutata erythropus]